jgi:hypothetical protein
VTVDSKESALSRWSRRKLEGRQRVEPEASPVAPTEPAAAGEILEEKAAEEKPVLTDADMPDIETLTEESDFSCFMSEGVSDELRNLALRKLFRAPVFNIRDGLDEYDDDFTTFEKLGDIVTSDMKHRMEMEAEKLREGLAAEDETGQVQADGADAAEEDFDDDGIEDIDGEELDHEVQAETLAVADTDLDSTVIPSDMETTHERQ